MNFVTPNMTLAIQRFASRHAPLKIITKTRDELEFLNDWICHHAAIVGIENILIADNMSRCQETLEIYRAWGDSLNWFSFDGYHNSIHQESCFPLLYQAIKASCDYVAFLDMDERLLCFSGDRWCADAQIVSLVEGMSASLISAPWLQNLPLRMDGFEFYREQLEWGVLFGKPLIAATNPGLGGGAIHAVQYASPDVQVGGLAVLHLTNFSREQRLRVNRNKLIRFGVIDESVGYEEIAGLQIDCGADQTLATRLVIARCVDEIQRLLPQSNTATAVPEERSICLLNGGDLTFGSEKVGQLFREFQADEQAWTRRVLPDAPKYLSEDG